MGVPSHLRIYKGLDLSLFFVTYFGPELSAKMIFGVESLVLMLLKESQFRLDMQFVIWQICADGFAQI